MEKPNTKEYVLLAAQSTRLESSNIIKPVRLMQPIRKKGDSGGCKESGCYPIIEGHCATATWKLQAGLNLH